MVHLCNTCMRTITYKPKDTVAHERRGSCDLCSKIGPLYRVLDPEIVNATAPPEEGTLDLLTEGLHAIAKSSVMYQSDAGRIRSIAKATLARVGAL